MNWKDCNTEEDFGILEMKKQRLQIKSTVSWQTNKKKHCLKQ